MKDELRIKCLKIAMIKKDFIKNDNKEYYDYEDYILEWINQSKFIKDNNGTFFEKISHNKQSNGEYDLKGGTKEIELKMLMDSSSIENMAHYSYGIYEKSATGVTIYTDSIYNIKNKDAPPIEYQIYFPIKIFRQKSFLDFVRIESMKKNEITDKSDQIIKSFIPKIIKDKHIVYYLPVNIYHPNQETTKEIATGIISVINDDLEGFITYRNHKTKKDTYICFISNNYVVFAIYSKSLKLEYYDMLKTNTSKLFEKLEDLTTFWK